MSQTSTQAVETSSRIVIHATKSEASNQRYELTDHEWTAIRPMLPNKPRGVPRVSDRLASLTDKSAL